MRWCHEYNGILDHGRIRCRFLKGVAVVVVRSKLGVTKEQGKFYQVDTLRVILMETLKV